MAGGLTGNKGAVRWNSSLFLRGAWSVHKVSPFCSEDYDMFISTFTFTPASTCARHLLCAVDTLRSHGRERHGGR